MEPERDDTIECIEDAIKADIAALGGPKKAAGIFFPDKTPDQGAALLRAWSNPERMERPNPGQYLLLKLRAKERGSFACVQYEERYLSCEVRWKEPREELVTLIRENAQDFRRIESTQRRLLALLERMGGQG